MPRICEDYERRPMGEVPPKRGASPQRRKCIGSAGLPHSSVRRVRAGGPIPAVRHSSLGRSENPECRPPKLTFPEKVTSRREHPESRRLDIGLLASRQFIPGRPRVIHTDPPLRQYGIQISGVEPKCSSKWVLLIADALRGFQKIRTARHHIRCSNKKLSYALKRFNRYRVTPHRIRKVRSVSG